jgi:tetratricopeptide (TPR) repeat protein
MRFYFKIILFISALSFGFDALAQSDGSVANLIKQGVELNNQKKYAEAAESYKAALTLEPDNVPANYQMAFTLFSAGKNTEALPFIKKATKGTNTKFTAAAYSLMGSIYQGTGQLPNAVAAYQNAIKADSSNQRIYYNLGIAYFKGKQYTEAEGSFDTALKKDSSDAGSWRMYALATFHQNKRAQALLGFCSFLLLEPTSAKSAEAFGNLQNLLQQGVLKPEPGYKLTLIIKGLGDYQSQIIKKALAATVTRKYVTPADLLAAQLITVFDALSSMPRDKYYTWYALVDYFGKLAATDNIPAFARYISQSAKPESLKWLKDNPDKLNTLNTWLLANKLNFR